MAEENLKDTFQALLDSWTIAIQTKDQGWYARHIADDFRGSSHPLPSLSLDKDRLIALDNAIDEMEATWIHVDPYRFGDIVQVRSVVRYLREAFAAGAEIGEGMPTGEQLGGYVSGNTVLYVSAWRHNGSHWQIYDMHQVGSIGKDS
ncbi:hypothetical protein [Niveispirillum sp. KHB5.9]|uniref:hypothetical protein n=1 Tax=Niveispirillum sp. KHB5.9 TaxID=3400269 RepID=UPI003A84D055